jgi:hypothetical protein
MRRATAEAVSHDGVNGGVERGAQGTRLSRPRSPFLQKIGVTLLAVLAVEGVAAAQTVREVFERVAPSVVVIRARAVAT